MKTTEEIKAEVEKLKELLPNIRPMSMFGDDNKAQLAAQIKVLENHWDNDDIYNEYDHAGIDEEIISSALDARQWLEGKHEAEFLSEGWEPLRQWSTSNPATN